MKFKLYLNDLNYFYAVRMNKNNITRSDKNLIVFKQFDISSEMIKQIQRDAKFILHKCGDEDIPDCIVLACDIEDYKENKQIIDFITKNEIKYAENNAHWNYIQQLNPYIEISEEEAFYISLKTGIVFS